MPSTYKTPGVYVEEVSTFPPSVAPVATAIPAFIGYTEKAIKNGEPITNVPTRISSFVEFTQLFGGAPDRNVVIRLTSDNDFLKAETLSNTYYLYDSLRMFYNNGGGDCYIVSVGNYTANVTLGDDTTGIQGGLKALEKYDEPTMIVAPDAVFLGDNNYTYQQLALAQCAKLQDRFLIGDLLKSDETTPGETFDERVKDYRDKIGISNLKYGAAYAPYLKASIPANLTYKDVRFAYDGVAISNADFDTTAFDVSRITLFGLTSDTAIRQIIYDLENASKASLAMATSVTTLAGTSGIEATLKLLLDDLDVVLSSFDETGASVWADVDGEMQALFDKILETLSEVASFRSTLPTVVAANPTVGQTVDFKLQNDVDALVADLKDVFDAICAHFVETDGANASNGTLDIFTEPSAEFTAAFGLFYNAGTGPADADAVATITAAYTTAQGGALPIITQLGLARDAAQAAIRPLASLLSDIISAASSYESTFNNSITGVFGTYKTLLSRAEQDLMVLPPSGTIAGVYTKVDNERGVWKAPANVSLSSVSGPTVNITSSEQEDLNVDVNAGKSINAIRAFTGKGILVWGARTLAGNDNEWRYVPVRRFFNFAEESIKKATEQFVFEPNDANTWVRVRAMIENFLILQWRAGALAGAKPEHAFFVKIGLGETMTALDILEGRMIVEIGMAVVRPAEFIILRFSHKMQES